MTGPFLTTPREAVDLIARMFGSDSSCAVSVREEKAFVADGWLSLGDFSIDVGNQSSDQLRASVKRGEFEWKLPSLTTVEQGLKHLLAITDQAKDAPKLRRALDAIAPIGIRAHLQH